MSGGIAREKVIDASSLASGIYFIRITDPYEIYDGKVLINR